MDHRRDKNAPRQLLGKEKSEFDQSPEIRKLDMRIEEATRDIAGSPTEHPAQFKERQKLYNEKRALLRLAETAYRKKWFSASYDSEALRQLQPDDENEKSLAPPQPTNAFHMIRHLMPARDRIANVLRYSLHACLTCTEHQSRIFTCMQSNSRLMPTVAY